MLCPAQPTTRNGQPYAPNPIDPPLLCGVGGSLTLTIALNGLIAPIAGISRRQPKNAGLSGSSAHVAVPARVQDLPV
jgi:hypothetical protein